MMKNDKEYLVQKIRSQYTEKEQTGLDELKALDSKVKRPANIFAYIFGSLSAITMGSGMSLVMTDIGDILGIEKSLGSFVGILVGVLGIVLLSLAYPLYNRTLRKEREKVASEILRLSEELMK